MPLTNTVIDTAKPADKPYKIHDALGMYLLVMPNGAKYFRMDYRTGGKRKTKALGVYPEITLDSARRKRDQVRQSLKSGTVPIKSKEEHGCNQANSAVIQKNMERSIAGALAMFSRPTTQAADHPNPGESATVDQENHKKIVAKTLEMFSQSPIEKSEQAAGKPTISDLQLFSDDQLQKELERRGYEVSIYRTVAEGK